MKKHLFILILALCGLLLPARAQQQFTVIRDTVSLDALFHPSKASEIYLKQVKKYRDYYFCICAENLFFEHHSDYRLLAVSIDGKEVKEVDNMDVFDEFYYDIFVWNDSLFLKPAHSNAGFCFDYANWCWRYVSDVPNYIYEDEKFYVIPRSMSSRYSFFVDKATKWYPETKNGWLQMELVNRPYLNLFGKCRIIKNDNLYYFIHNGKVDTLPVNRPGEPGFFDNLGDVLDEEGVFTPKSKWAFENDPIRRFHCYGGYRPRIRQDTLIHNAFCLNGQLYYIVTFFDTLYIAQMDKGKIRKIQPLVQVNTTYLKEPTAYWDLNRAPNCCQMEFVYGHNGLTEVNVIDTTVYVRLFFTNQQAMPSVSSDTSVAPYLDFLLKNLPDLPLSKVDSFEQQTGGFGHNRFLPLYNYYFPREYQKPAKYGKLPYYRISEDGWMCRHAYCVDKPDSIVKSVFLEWKRSDYVKPDGEKYRRDNISAKCAEVAGILTRLIGTQPQKEKNCLKWTYNGLTVELRENGRMVIY